MFLSFFRSVILSDSFVLKFRSFDRCRLRKQRIGRNSRNHPASRRYYALPSGSQTEKCAKWRENHEFGTFLHVRHLGVCESAFKRVFCARIRAIFQTPAKQRDTAHTPRARIRLSDFQSGDTLPPDVQSRTNTFTSPQPGSPKLHFLAWGDERNPKLILLHGGGSNAHWWDHIAPHLADRFFVVALDFRGHGVSDYPDDLVVGAFNDDLELLLAQLGNEDVLLVGHSMGSHVALDHASRHPTTRGIVLIDISRGASRAVGRRSRLALRMRGTYASRDDAIRRFQFLPEAPQAEETLRLHIAQHSVREEPDGRYSYCFDPRWFTLSSRPPPDHTRVVCPTLIVRGSKSTILTEEGARELASELADARCAVIQDAGHHVHVERPEATLAALQAFLSEFES
jgi:pimeloyl-ACP methyl ester carboxylesterase